MKDLKAIRGNVLLRQMIAEGEHVKQDFKFAISDARKIARSLSAFANNQGGRLLIGVKDNGVVAGVRNEEDIYVVEQAAERYCNPSQSIDFKAYRIDGKLTVIVASIDAADSRPVSVVEADGSLKAYYRVADENIAAHPLMVRGWKLAARGVPEPLSQKHYAVAALFDSPGKMIDVKTIALSLHLTLEEAENIVVRLAAAGLIGFSFDGTRFVPSSNGV